MKKRIFSTFLALAIIISMFPNVGTVASAATNNDGLCPHHTEHTDCGYTAASEGAPCSHEHTKDSGCVALTEESEAAVLADESEIEAAAEGYQVWVVSTGGNDANPGTQDAPVATLAKALELMNDAGNTGTIYVSGTFSGATALTGTIPDGVILVIWGNTTSTGTSGINGITLNSGAVMKCANGAALTMKNYSTAVYINEGAVLTDGNYTFTGNTYGIYTWGSIAGTKNRTDVVITATDTNGFCFFREMASFKNCTVSFTSNTRTQLDAHLILDNADMTLSGFGQSPSIRSLQMNNSRLVMKSPGKIGGIFEYGQTGLILNNIADSLIVDSYLEFDYGTNAGLSVGDFYGEYTTTFISSELVFKNGGQGGLNVNMGNVRLIDSTIRGDGRNTGALFGVQGNRESDQILITGNSLVETPAAKDRDNGASTVTDGYVVTGGSHLVKYAPDYNSSYGSTIPTNGPENGSESLMLFTLTNPGLNVINPINKNGDRYEYQVAKASSDGKKHVWAPGVTVEFYLANAQAAFADGTTGQHKYLSTIRGYSLSTVEGNAYPQDPVCSSEDTYFLGWYYREGNNADGEELAFTQAAYDGLQLDSDLYVYAKWGGEPPEIVEPEPDDEPDPRVTIYGDILVQNDGDAEYDTQSTYVFLTEAGGMLNFKATINARTIVNQMEAQADLFNITRYNWNLITLSEVRSDFEVNMYPAEGLIFPQNKNAYRFDGYPYIMTNMDFNDDGSITFYMTLKEPETMDTFEAMHSIIDQYADFLVIYVDGVKVPADAKEGDTFTTTGTVEGNFFANATYNATKRSFNFEWRTIQDPDIPDVHGSGLDYTLKDAANKDIISLTVKVPEDKRGYGPDGNDPDGTPDDLQIIVHYRVEPTHRNRGKAGVMDANNTVEKTYEVFNFSTADGYKPNQYVNQDKNNPEVDPQGSAIANENFVFWKWTVDDLDNDEYEQWELEREHPSEEPDGEWGYYEDDDGFSAWDSLADFYGNPQVGHVYLFTADFHSLRHQLNDYGTILPGDEVFDAIEQIEKSELEDIKIQLAEDTNEKLLNWVLSGDNDFNHAEGAGQVGNAYYPDEVDIHVQVKLEVEGVRYTEVPTTDYDKKLEIDITPYFQVAAAIRNVMDGETTEGDVFDGYEQGTDYVILSEGFKGVKGEDGEWLLEPANDEGWIKLPVTSPVSMFIPMPAAFATDGDTVKIEHFKDITSNDPPVRTLTQIVSNGAVEFTNYNGFSTFVFTVKSSEPEDPSVPSDPTGRLSVTKKVTGDAGEADRKFHFKVTIGTETYEFTLKGGENWTSEAFPAGTQYTVTEADANEYGYTTTMPDSATGVIQAGTTVNVEVVNHKERSEPGTTPDPTDPIPDPTPDPVPDKPLDDVSKTGDESHPALWMTLMLLSLAGIVITLSSKKKMRSLRSKDSHTK